MSSGGGDFNVKNRLSWYSSFFGFGSQPSTSTPASASSPPTSSGPTTTPSTTAPTATSPSNAKSIRRTPSQTTGLTRQNSKRSVASPPAPVAAATAGPASPRSQMMNRSASRSNITTSGASTRMRSSTQAPKSPVSPRSSTRPTAAAVRGTGPSGSTTRSSRDQDDDWDMVDDVPPPPPPDDEGYAPRPRSGFALVVSKSFERFGHTLSSSVSSLFTPREPSLPPRVRQVSLAPSIPAEQREYVPQLQAAPIPPKQRTTRDDPVEAQLEKWDNDLANQFPILSELEQKTGISKVNLALFVILIVFFVVFLGFGMSVLCSLVGYLYPLFASFKTIENPDSRAVKQWLTYWVVFALFCTFESVFDKVLAWIPLYNLLKISFLIWCFLPRFQGATVVYTNAIKPLVEPVSQDIDEMAATVKDAASLSVSQATMTLKQRGRALTEHLSKTTGGWLPTDNR